ncbi:MAG TPA: hypothetical protein VNO79_05440, partial [Actinomycetota bacterium]|nr:hypothetical protein [Actinomycetota bacterium]
MPRFVVLVRRVEVSEAEIAVTARSREEAEEMALRDDDLYFTLADNVVDAELEAVSVRELDPNHSAMPLHAGKDTICSLCLRPVRWTGRVEAGRTIP